MVKDVLAWQKSGALKGCRKQWKSEGPIYYLQTLSKDGKSKDYVLVYEERDPWEKDYYLEFYNHKMVKVSGELIKENIIKVNEIEETCAPHLSKENA